MPGDQGQRALGEGDLLPLVAGAGIERQRAMGTASHLPARRAFCAYDKPAREGYAPECEPTRDDTTGTRPRQ